MIYAILCRQKVPGTAVCRIKPTMGTAVKYRVFQKDLNDLNFGIFYALIVKIRYNFIHK